jgi:hypothetical protein
MYPKLNRYSFVWHCSLAGSLLVKKAEMDFKNVQTQCYCIYNSVTHYDKLENHHYVTWRTINTVVT